MGARDVLLSWSLSLLSPLPLLVSRPTCFAAPFSSTPELSRSDPRDAAEQKKQLWDVCSDQEAVDLVADCADDAQAASQKLLDHALNRFSTDNLSVLVVCTLPLSDLRIPAPGARH